MDLTTPTTARRITVAAWIGAAAGTVGGQLHAIARGLSHPEDWQEAPLNRAWAQPASEALRPLFDWADPWTVYITYGKLWTPIAVAFTLAAILVFQQRQPAGAERRLWQLVLGGQVLMTASLASSYFFPQWMEASFGVGLVAMLLIGLGGTALGGVLLRRGFRPRSTALALLAFLPLFFVITMVTSMGSALLPLAWGWALAAQMTKRPATPERERQESPYRPAASAR